MILNRCAHESEVAQWLEHGGWPAVCPAELQAHVNACRSCGDLVLVTESFQRARAEAASTARISTPSALWWRAQLRRRQAAVERIGKPLLGAQIFALVICLLVGFGLLASQAQQGIAWLKELPQTGVYTLTALWSSTLLDSNWTLMVLIPAAVTLALLGGTVVYLASEKL
ncbi:MAG: hypothetical protein ABR906_07580 [Terracidiphilus sp.]|jgi:hypothetical protein